MPRNARLFDGQTCFITTTITAWIDLFTKPLFKHMMVDSLNYCCRNKGLTLFGWCLMSNHIHLLGRADEGIAINDIMRDLKKFTSKKFTDELIAKNDNRSEWMLNIFKFTALCHPKNIGEKVWKDGFDCQEIFSGNVFDKKLDYIHNNPVKEEIVEEPHHYLYSSARDYAGIKGLVDVVVV